MDSQSNLDSPSEASISKDGNTKIPVSFLLSLTNPKAESMVEAFFDEPGRDDDAPSVDLQLVPDTSTTQEMMTDDGLFLPWGFGQMSHDMLADAASFDFHHQTDDDPPDIDRDPVLAPLLTDLKTLHDNLLATDPSYDGTFNNTLASQVFTRSNRDTFVPAYFRHTHRDMPLIHRPTFNPSTCSAPLLLTIFFCGALYSPPRDCVLATPAFFRITEEYIFQSLDTQLAQRSKHNDDGAEGCESHQLYETLQAALLIHGVQYMANNAAARRRNWMVRRPALVEAVRALGLAQARHTQMIGRVPEWRRFVWEETRIK